MRKSDFENGKLDGGTLDARQKALRRFPYSVIVETAYPELDMADAWCQKQLGPKDEAWTQLWLDKTDYDYGFAEFFFSRTNQREEFEHVLLTFYGVGPRGKWRTDGCSKDDGRVIYVYLDEGSR